MPLVLGHARGGFVEHQHAAGAWRARARSRADAACHKAACASAGPVAASRPKRVSRSSISATISGRPPATRQKSAPEPLRSEIARPSDSAGRQIGKELIDLERAREAQPHARAGRKRRDSRPAVGPGPRSASSTPVSRLISVVLPAPLGPISACRAPGWIANDTSSVAISPPKLRCKPTRLERRSAHAAPRRAARGAKRAISRRVASPIRSRPDSTSDDQQRGRSRIPNIPASRRK